MSELLFGIVDASGNLLAVGANPESVAREAKAVARGRNIYDLTIPEEDPRENPPERGNKALRAFKDSMLPKVTEREVMALSVKEAFTRLQTAPVLDAAPKSWGEFVKYPLVATLSSNVKMEKNVEKAFAKLGVETLVDGHAPQSIGLSLTPHTLAWQLTELETETGGGRVGLLAPPIPGKKQYPNLCRYSTSGCRTGCLVLTGQSGMGGRDLEGRLYDERLGRKARKYKGDQTVRWKGKAVKVKHDSVFMADRMAVTEQTSFYAKVRRTALLFHDPVAYCRMLVEAIRLVTCTNPNTHIRLNVLSDIPWELFFPDLFKMFDTTSFYDYTKVPGRKPPPNYTLVFSYSGSATNVEETANALERGMGVAVVVYGTDKNLKTTKQSEWEQVNQLWGYPTINGDIYDIRSYDRPALKALGYDPDSGYIISLRYKAPKIITELGAVTPREDVGAFVVDVRYDKASGVFFGPETASDSAPKLKGSPRGGARKNPSQRPRGVKWLD